MRVEWGTMMDGSFLVLDLMELIDEWIDYS